MGDVIQFRRARLTGFIPETGTPVTNELVESLHDVDRELSGLIDMAKARSPTILMHDDEILPPPGAA